MSIQTETPQTTDRNLECADAFANGLRKLADFAVANPELASELTYAFERVLIANGGGVRGPGREFLARYARAGARFGATVDKDFDNDAWASVDLGFGPVSLHVYAARADVCERVVVGTEEVTKEVPDPEALAAVPKVTVTETVEKVEWRCHPLLADAVDDQKAAAA